MAPKDALNPPGSLTERLTPGVRRWLEHLRENGPAKRPSRVGFLAMKKGYTEWDYRDPENGKIIKPQQAHTKYGSRWWDTVVHHNLERITPIGVRALSAQP